MDPDPQSRSFRRTMYRAAERLTGRRIEATYRALLAHDTLGADEIRALQWHKLKALLEDVYSSVPFYRRRFEEAGIRPDDVRGWEDFRRLPLTSKRDIKAAYPHEVVASDRLHTRLIERVTTGTTDAPLRFVIDTEMFDLGVARALRVLDWAGSTLGDRMVQLGPIRERRGLQHRLFAHMTQRLVLDTLALTTSSTPLCCPADTSVPDRIDLDRAGRYCRSIAAQRPGLIYGYVTDLLALAAYIEHTGFTGIRPRAVVSSAEILTDPARRRLETIFGAEVFDLYGATEFPAIACECEVHNGLHVLSDSYVVEIISDGRDASPGETGEVVITDLDNRVMPFIRYRIGDAARATDRRCSCGRSFPLIDMIEGRTSEVVVAPGGRLLLARRFATILQEMEDVRAFRIVQERIDRLDVQIVTRPSWTSQHGESLLQRIRALVGEDMEVTLSQVPDLAVDPSRKERYLYSSVEYDIVGGRCYRS